MVEGTNESFLARKLNELKISNSSGPCACIHLLLVSIVRSFTLQHGLHAQRKQTLRSRSLSSFKMHLQILKVLILSNRRKRFKIPGGRFFGATPVEEEDDQLDDYGSDSSNETSQEIDSDDHFDFSNRKCRHLQPKHVDVHLEITEIHSALLSKLKSSSIAETTLRNFPRLNSIW